MDFKLGPTWLPSLASMVWQAMQLAPRLLVTMSRPGHIAAFEEFGVVERLRSGRV
jgi:hypothetical protein